MARPGWTWMALVLVAGCGGSGDTVAVGDYSDRLLTAYCENKVGCGSYGSMESCLASVGAANHQLEQSVAAGRAVYDAEQAAACVVAYRTLTCDATDKTWWQGPPGCDGVFTGAVADGGECFASAECASERCTLPACDQACCAGTCATTAAPGAVGAACGNGRCVEGAYCNQGTCAAFVPGGEPCSADFYCASGFGCSGDICVDLPDRGDACPGGECAGWGDRCDAATITCVARAGVGEACTVNNDCQVDLRCNQRTCRALPASGQACAAGGACAPGAFCEGGTCAAERADGAACDDDAQCGSGYCGTFAPSPVCAARPLCG